MARGKYRRLALSLPPIRLVAVIWACVIGTGLPQAQAAAVEERIANARNPAREVSAITDAHWIVDSSRPGADLPSQGRSLFDRLFIELREDGYEYEIPFPLSALRERLLLRLRRNEYGESPLKEVLIPLGRSLQRMAAAPSFFRFPRVVLAVDGESDAEPGMIGQHLKDRLYIGYIEEPGVLEVISYNETAGRFEFQIVKNYRAGGEPEVVYANRAVCIACHQNATPIFSRPLWSETNADPRVAGLLEAEQRDYYGIHVSLGIDTPAAIDAATDRANLIPLTMFLWNQGCEQSGAGDTARRCRALAIGMALQYRLTGSLWFADDTKSDWRLFAGMMASAVERHWPGGLLVSSPDIPNRVPMTGQRSAQISGTPPPALGTADQTMQQRHIPAAFEPLQPRPPLETVSATTAAKRLVLGLADALAASDMERLDIALRNGGSNSGTERIYGSHCVLKPRVRPNGEYRVSLHCPLPPEKEDDAFSLKGRVYFKGENLIRGAIKSVTTADGTDAAGLNIIAAAFEERSGNRQLRLSLARSNMQARLADGNAITELRIDWPFAANGRDIPLLEALEPVAAEMRVSQDMAKLRDALDTLLKKQNGNNGLFHAGPFQRRQLLGSLYPLLGTVLADCCPDDAELPAARTDRTHNSRPPGVVSFAAGDPTIGFYALCARCHFTTERFPPNFLFGDRSQVETNLAQCAERLFLRLSMWSLPAGSRPKTPMPPIHALPMLDLEEAQWRGSADLERLLDYLRKTLQQQTGKQPSLAELMERGYENLRSCLAPVAQQTALGKTG